MRKLFNSSNEFFERHPFGKSSAIRGFAALLLSAGTGIGVVYLNYYNYWKVTIYRTQTVDFNMLATLLPSKVSTHLLKNDTKGLQEVLDTNYGLFGIIITNCKSASVDCPEQQIIYGSKIKIEQISNTKQRLVPQGKYAHVWTQKFNGKDTSAHLLKEYNYIILRNPSSSKPDWKFESPRDSQIVLSQQPNVNLITGRIYFVRGNPPSFPDELKTLNPFSKGSRNLVYDAISGAALLTGILAWLLSEIFHYRSRKADRLEIESERALRDAAEQLNQANTEKSNAEVLALSAQVEAAATALQLNEATQAKLQSDENALSAQAEAAATALRLNEATQAKLQSDENALSAQAEVAATALRFNITDRQRLEAQRNALSAQAEAAATTLRLNEATQAKLQSDENALSAQSEAAATTLRLNEATQAKLQSDENALSAQVEAAATTLRLNEATQAKLQSDENALSAQSDAAATTLRLNEATQAKSKVDKNAQYLLKALNDKRQATLN